MAMLHLGQVLGRRQLDRRLGDPDGDVAAVKLFFKALDRAGNLQELGLGRGSDREVGLALRLRRADMELAARHADFEVLPGRPDDDRREFRILGQLLS